ncbi:MAG: DNA gyrase/topoisomerase IV subunit A [Bacteroidales bacterium]|jgi:topoisomerase-4 subunit A|nr:DNA gyrase/topoisomerase IV subunit A [Bacteroidales bacterium]
MDEIREDMTDGLEETANLNPEQSAGADTHRTIKISGLYENWFLDYASYVILERAVPEVIDGLKPVQRRILHSMKQLDDGRFNKVANIIGHTMQYHPHGDASIGDALVQLGQKDLLIETQGNWGNILTGDSAAAPRYIEARLSKFALEVVFNPKTTPWKPSYDGRNKEPVTLPVKFPLLLAQGVEGIAVGLASKILPHNFIELIDASINILKEEDFEIYPDFQTGGLIDVSRYNDGARGGKVRIRAKIKKIDNKTLVIQEIPFGVTTTNLIDSIIQANDKKKIKIRKIDDNTAAEAEILVHLVPGTSPDQTIDALYAFTLCEVPVSPNACVIRDGKPQFLDVREILRISTRNTVGLIRRELEIRLDELREQWHYASLEKIFIEHKIYRKIETCETWEEVIETIDKGLAPFTKKLVRPVTQEDIVRLTEIRIKRISKFDSNKADDSILSLENEMEEVQNHLDHLIDYAILYFEQIRKKYSAGRERKTEIRSFDTIEAAAVAAASQKLYFNREEGFAGTSLKKDEYICDCSDIDDVILFREDGTFLVRKVEGKFFTGKDVVYINVFKKNDERTIYNMVYRDGKKGSCYVKRFAVVGVTRDKEYDLTKGNPGSKVVYFSANPNGEAEMIRIFLRPKPRMKKTTFDFDFSSIAIKGRSSQGNLLSKNPVRQIVKKEHGVSTLGARGIWYDESVKRLNAEERGIFLGAFEGDDKILTLHRSGVYKLYNYDLSTHFDEDMLFILKFDPQITVSAVYFDGNTGTYYLKRFAIEPSDKAVGFLNEHKDTRLEELSIDWLPRLQLAFLEKNGKQRPEEIIDVAGFIGVKSYRAKGRKLSEHAIGQIRWLDPLPYEPSGEDDDGEEQREEDVVSFEILPATKPPEEEPEPGKQIQPESGNDEHKPPESGKQITLDFF